MIVEVLMCVCLMLKDFSRLYYAPIISSPMSSSLTFSDSQRLSLSFLFHVHVHFYFLSVIEKACNCRIN